MKKLILILSLIIILFIGLSAFRAVKLGGITGKIMPITAATKVSLVAGTDTLNAEIKQGVFTFINLKEGVYVVSIKRTTPYKDLVIDRVAVKDSATTDLGEIKLQQ